MRAQSSGFLAIFNLWMLKDTKVSGNSAHISSAFFIEDQHHNATLLDARSALWQNNYNIDLAQRQHLDHGAQKGLRSGMSR